MKRLAVALASALAAGCSSVRTAPAPQSAVSLKDAFAPMFRIGAALNAAQFSGEDERGAALVRTHFNSITPENVLKWERVHPRPDSFDFAAPDRYVAFGEKNGMFIVGHTLVWHQQTPGWVFRDATGGGGGGLVGRDTLLNRLRDHIRAVVGRYRGRVKGWDVVNEALNEDGTLRKRPWQQDTGE